MMNHFRRLCIACLVCSFLRMSTAACVADDPTGRDLAFSLQAAFADAIEQAEPSLVSVARIRTSDALLADSLLGAPDDPRAMDFRRQIEQRRRGGDPVNPSWFDTSDPNWVPQDFGSGVIIDPDGLILTNYHVVDRYERLRVVLHTGKILAGDIWAADPRSDLAVIRVDARDLKPIKLGNASKVKKGHIVLALGNPLAIARDGRASASWGIISNISRRLPPPSSNNPEDLTLHHSGTLFQTDARLNYGTSGGALINLHGEMIGLVTSLAAVRGFDQAAGYAIPLDDMMLRILAVLREGREVEYGFLGIRPDDVRPNDGDPTTAGMPKEGALVRDCFNGSPAYQGGMLPGDVITSVDGVPVRNREELVLNVGTRFAGNRVPFTVVRSGKRMNLNVALGKFPVAGQIYASVRPPNWRGLRVDYATLLLKNAFTGQERLSDVPDGGVLVISVDSGSPAANAGIGPNAIITHIGSTRVRNPAEFHEAVKNLKGTVEVRTDQDKHSVSE